MSAKTIFTFAGGVVTGLILGVWLFSAPSPQVTSVQQRPAQPAPAPPQVDTLKVQQEVANLEDLLKNDPGNYQAWKKLGDNLFDLDDFQRSVDAYRKALEIDDGDPNVWTDMGIMYRRIGNPIDAIGAFDEAIKRSATHALSRLNKGVVYVYDLKDLEQGAQAFEEYLKLDPNGERADQVRSELEVIKQNIAAQKGTVPAAPEGSTGSDPSNYFPKPQP